MYYNNLEGDKPTGNTQQVQDYLLSSSASLSYQDAALLWFDFGLSVIPVTPGTKQTALKWDPWLDGLSANKIHDYWQQHPDHELGFIVGDDVIVFDTDSPEATTALHQLMESFDLSCNHVVSTAKGEHYYFRRAAGTTAKPDAHDTKDHPDRLDIRTGRSMIILPPSTGKSVSLSEAESVDDLIEVGQDFVDAVYRHNGREAPRPPVPREPITYNPAAASLRADEISTLLEVIDPDCGYADWIAVGMAIHYRLDGSDDGFALFNSWSSKGSKYQGLADLKKKWASFDGHDGDPVKMGTIYKLAADTGVDVKALFEEFFEVIKDTVAAEHDLAKFSLRGMSAQLEKEMQEQVFILGRIAILGHWTVIYASPNTGKTLLLLYLLVEGIKSGAIDPEKLFYINADDTSYGLLQKLRLAEKHGFHMLSPGRQDFQAKDFLKYLRGLCAKGQARGTIVALDTLKKFTDLMDKRTAAEFGIAIREFIGRGGTVIALAHVNKRPGADGKPIYAGTSDIVDDADCAYVMDTLNDSNDVKTVQFENIKSRGMVTKQAAYEYSTLEGQDYNALLASVAAVDDSKATVLRDTALQQDSRDLPLIETIKVCINDGITGKTKIAAKAASETGASQRHALRVMENYSGSDPAIHHWKSTVGLRGLITYEVHTPPEDQQDTEDL
jgi:hypothetical protein